MSSSQFLQFIRMAASVLHTWSLMQRQDEVWVELATGCSCLAMVEHDLFIQFGL